MAEQIPQSINANAPPHQETSCFGFLKKKEGKAEDDIVLTDKSDSNEGKYQEKRTLVDELQRKDSHSSSSSDEEVEEGGERKKKKGLKEGGENGGGPMEECSDDETKEKKGFVEKIKEKLPGHHEKEEIIQTHPPAAEVSLDQEKKGIIEKIKEKLPGHHKDE